MNSDALTLAPNEEDALRAAIGTWVAAGKPQISPAERLRKLRAAMQKEVRPVRISIWPKFAVAAVIAAMLAVAFHAHGLRQTIPQPAVNQKRNDQQVAKAPDVPRAPVVPAAEYCAHLVVVSDAAPVYRRSGNAEWKPVTADGCQWGDVVQTPSENGGELLAFDGGSLNLDARTIVRLTADRSNPSVQLLTGKLTATGGKRGIQVSGMDEHKSRIPLRTLKTSEHAIFENFANATAFAAVGTRKLIDDTTLTLPTAYTIDGMPIDAVKLEQNSANLLKTISCNFEQKSVTEIVAGLGAALDIQTLLSPGAEAQCGKKLIDVHYDNITGAEALAKLAETLGLKLRIEGGNVLFALPEESKQVPQKDENF